MPLVTWLVVATLIGGTLSAGGANAINNFVDRDIDDRTVGLPLDRLTHKDISIGQGPRNSFVISSENLPRSYKVFHESGGRYTLNFAAAC